VRELARDKRLRAAVYGHGEDRSGEGRGTAGRGGKRGVFNWPAERPLR